MKTASFELAALASEVPFSTDLAVPHSGQIPAEQNPLNGMAELAVPLIPWPELIIDGAVC